VNITGNAFYLIPLLILLCLSAISAAAETALLKANRVRIRHMAEEGDHTARRLDEILKEPDRFLSTLLLVNNFVNILSSALAAVVLVSIFGKEGIFYATAIMTFMVLVFGEITPKIIAAYRSEEVSLLFAVPLILTIKLLRPLVWFLNSISMGIVRLFGVRPDKHDHNFTEDDIGSAIFVGHKDGFIAPPKAKMLLNVIDLDSLPVRKALIPLGDVTSLSADCTLDEIIRIDAEENYTRYPVYDGEPENIIGYFHTRDAWPCLDKRETFSLRERMREAIFVPETKSMLKQLMDFQKTHSHMTFVVDEFGTVKGIITLEDIIEEITGDISDEHDQPVEGIMPVGQHTYIVKGSTPLRDIGRIVDRDFPEDVDTIAGLIYSQLDRIPHEGESIEWENMRLGIERMKGNRIIKVRITID
jgi:putative hemolysin